MKTKLSKLASHILGVHSLFSVLIFATVIGYGMYLLFNWCKVLVLPAIPMAFLSIAVIAFGGFFLTGRWHGDFYKATDTPDDIARKNEDRKDNTRTSAFYVAMGVASILAVALSQVFAVVVLCHYIDADHALYQKVLFVTAMANTEVMLFISLRKLIMA